MTGVIILTITGVLLAVAIGLVTRFFGIKQNLLAEKLQAIMPGANCGGCGFAGCADYVDAMVNGKAQPGLCPSMSAEALKIASTLLGQDVVVKERKVALIACSGDDAHAVRRGLYNGVTDCKNAAMVAGGGKGCLYGCLGLGSCARICPFGAIEITGKHLARVHADLCTGCGKCVSACPRRLIRLVPRTSRIHVYCSNPEVGKNKLPICSDACIGCRKCAKASKEGQMQFNGFLASINYDNPPDETLAQTCPTGALRNQNDAPRGK